MPQQFPLQLLIAWIAFFCSAVGQFHHEQAIRRGPAATTRMLRAMEISQLLWIAVAATILIYYFIVARWYWPLALAIGGSMLGAVVAGLLFGVVGERAVSACAFIVWPVSAAYAAFVIHSLP